MTPRDDFRDETLLKQAMSQYRYLGSLLYGQNATYSKEAKRVRVEIRYQYLMSQIFEIVLMHSPEDVSYPERHEMNWLCPLKDYYCEGISLIEYLIVKGTSFSFKCMKENSETFKKGQECLKSISLYQSTRVYIEDIADLMRSGTTGYS